MPRKQRKLAHVTHDLGERVKELTALHEAARILGDTRVEVPRMLEKIAALLPPAFQYPEVTVASVRYGDALSATPGFRDAPWKIAARFRTRDGTAGNLQAGYREARPASIEGPFLAEERRLMDSLAEMVETALNRRLAEQGLNRSQERLTLALAAAGMGVWEWDLVTNRVSWTEQLEQIAGLRAGSFPGTFAAFETMVHSDDRALLDAAIRRAMDDPARGDAFAAEFRLVRPDGETRTLVSSGRVMRDAQGVPRHMLGMTHDVSGLRDLEQQIRQAQRVEAVGRLAGGVAHDFNNLLTAIKGYSEFVIDALEPEDKRRKDVEEIAAAADRAAALTRQLLAFSRHQVLAPRVLDPNHVVAGMERLLRRLIGSDVDLRVAFCQDRVAVRADPGQLEQVVMNLVVNARDAMPKGGVVTIETVVAEFDERVDDQGASLEPGRYVVLAVSDTGSGMTAETKARLFEPYFTTKEPGRGTGLGLATVYGIVRQSGGAIWVYSELGKGATFKVYLPWVGDAVEPSAPVIPSGASLRGDETVVFVDDDPHVRLLAERALRAHGYQVLVASGAEEALSLVSSVEALDLLITDIVMPRMAGPELARRVRAARPDALVLYITGYTERAIDDEDLPAGALFQKPFTPKGLLRRVREILDA